MKILGIIPARYGSTRFPAKALAEIGGKTIIQRVFEQASKAELLNKVIVATDHSEIYKHVKSFGGTVAMTSENHQSGTDRCNEVLCLEKEQFDYVINIQGDEPFIDPEQINALANCLDGQTEIATLIKKITDSETLFNPNLVKAIVNNDDEAIYFSRTAVPYLRSIEKENWLSHFIYFKHLGIYAYRADILKEITKLSVSKLEKAESLEQLRWIENGYKIKTVETEMESIGIDTPDDLEAAKKLL